MTTTSREVRLARVPGLKLSPDDFRIDTVELGDVGEGQVRVRNLYMSIDPYMRLGLAPQGGVVAAKKPGDGFDGAALGIVEESRADALPVGTLVLSQYGWREQFLASAGELQAVPPSPVPHSWLLGVLGLTGLTAYAGIERAIQPTAGETIFISGAAGAVGSIACQLAILRGARVLGSAGSADKMRWLKDDLGVAAVTNYKTDDLAAFLAAEAPDGLDCYFDNVGGAILDTTLLAMKDQGRVGLCGAISQYETENYRSGPSQFFTIIERNLTMKGFNVNSVIADAHHIIGWLGALAAEGKLEIREIIVEGLEAAPEAFVSLFHGGVNGKLIVRLAPGAVPDQPPMVRSDGQ